MERPFRPSPQNAWEAARVRRDYNRRCVGAGFLYLGIYIIIQSAVSMIYAAVLVAVQLSGGGEFSYEAFMTPFMKNSMQLTGIVNLLTLVAYWIFFSVRRCAFSEETRLRRVGFPALLLMLPLGFSSHVLISAVLSYLPESWLSVYAESSAGLGSAAPLSVLCIVFIAPFAEEVIFRGLLYTRLRRGMGRLLALLIAGAIFGLLHGQLLWAAYAFLLSLLLSAVLDWYDSLWAGVLLHISFNASQYAVSAFFGGLEAPSALVGTFLLTVPLILLARRAGLRARR